MNQNYFSAVLNIKKLTLKKTVNYKNYNPYQMFPGIVDFVHDDCVFNHFLCFISLRGTTAKKFAKITMISFTKHNEPSNFSYTEGFIMLFERFAYLNHKLHLNIKFYKSHS